MLAQGRRGPPNDPQTPSSTPCQAPLCERVPKKARLNRDPDPPQLVRYRLARVNPVGAPTLTSWIVAYWARRTVCFHSHPLEHLLHAIDVIPVAHHDARLKVHQAHDLGCPGYAADRTLALGFNQNRL